MFPVERRPAIHTDIVVACSRRLRRVGAASPCFVVLLWVTPLLCSPRGDRFTSSLGNVNETPRKTYDSRPQLRDRQTKRTTQTILIRKKRHVGQGSQPILSHNLQASTDYILQYGFLWLRPLSSNFLRRNILRASFQFLFLTNMKTPVL